ncbi:reverse transcriptase domain-containing protein [Scytonema sp. UIC 10036]|uniref:reverse transcriptase domain-containing protein n=1 Tax=Scytonema sp. UIC 10036 TaxID=2304196 RepID=UPI00140FA268|nr:reverse transcriptase domain-containing protein [Scytonema sp. UIC 10036]
MLSFGGGYTDIEQGISLGCPLSPLIGALYNKLLDDKMAAMGCFYVCYMDDWVVLAPTRWALRRAIKVTNQELAGLKLEMHPDKTFIGQVARGFDFLGYRFALQGLGVARVTVERFAQWVSRLYEQGATASLHWEIRSPLVEMGEEWSVEG